MKCLVKISSYAGNFYFYRSKDWEEFDLDISGSNQFWIKINPPIILEDDRLNTRIKFGAQLSDITFKNQEDLKQLFKLIDIRNIIT